MKVTEKVKVAKAGKNGKSNRSQQRRQGQILSAPSTEGAFDVAVAAMWGALGGKM